MEHNYRKQNLVTNPDGTDLWVCETCGSRYLRHGLAWNPPKGACQPKPKKESQMSDKTDKPAKRKLTQAEWDAKYGDDKEEPTVVTTAKKTEKKSPAKKPSPVKKSAKTEEKVHGRIVNTNSRKLKSNIGSCTKKSYVAIAAAFGKGKTVEDAVTDLEIGYEPPRSKRYAKDPRKYLLGYISTMLTKKFLIEV